MLLSLDKVRSYAPDQATLDRGEKLAQSGKWVVLNIDKNVVWGRCKGSGTSTYKTAVQLNIPIFTCSCPVRKKPCKHLIGLMLLLVKEKQYFMRSKDYPEWVSKWLDKALNETKKSEKKGLSPAQQKNRLERLKRMKQGANDLEVWILDLIRQGIASVEAQSPQFWQDISARMVDTQLSSIGPRIRDLQLLPSTSSNWAAEVLKELASLYLVVSGFKHLENLPEELQEQLIRVAGITDKKSDVLNQEGIVDQWGIVGSFEGETIDNVSFRRTWLLGRKSKRYALLIDFSFNNMGYDFQWKVGHIYDGELMYYPASYPLRALIKLPDPLGENIQQLKGDKLIEGFLEKYAAALKENPWLLEFPVCLQDVIPVKVADGIILVDESGKSIPVLSSGADWAILSVSGGHPITLFGEWVKESLVPLSIVAQGRFIPIGK